MKQRICKYVLGIVTALVFLFPVTWSHAESALVFKGCSIIRRAFMSEAAVAYEKATGQHIDVMGGGATLGIRATAAGDSDIGGSCRPALPERFPTERGIRHTRIGWDALVFITHPSNPVDSITLEHAKAVLQGQIDNWQMLGGPNQRLIAVFRSQVPEHGGKFSGVGHMTRVMLFGDADFNFTENALFFRHSAEVEEAIESIPYAFGVTGVSSALKRNLKILHLNGIEPTRQQIASAHYPLFRPLYLSTRGVPQGDVARFIHWLTGEAGQQVVAQQGTVTLREGRMLEGMFRFWPAKKLLMNPPGD
ncbi:MAG: substrate-binding domain-containing protein [Candidatus Thiodiazotropha sp.]|jgi:phosphate transport system substrate-binding protein